VTAVCSGVELLTGTRSGQLARWRSDSASIVHYLSRDDQAGQTTSQNFVLLLFIPNNAQILKS